VGIDTSTTTQLTNPTTTPTVKALESIYNKLNHRFFESLLSNAIITIAEQGRRNAYGWCTSEEVWVEGVDNKYYEINICAEYLNRPIEDTCETLLHEMVHLFNALRGVQDCSRSGLYHNRRFKISAEQHGLVVEKHSKYGFCLTTLSSEALDFIKSLNLSSLTLFRDSGCYDRGSGDDELVPGAVDIIKTQSNRKYVCPTCPKISFWASKEIKVRCDICDELFIRSKN
jgi:hypothetical protein